LKGKKPALLHEAGRIIPAMPKAKLDPSRSGEPVLR
jgi:hypothetical protein